MAIKNPYSHQAIGRRKEAVARVYLAPGDGSIMINDRSVEDFFGRLEHRHQVLKPFLVTETTGKYRAKVTVKGGGNTGQAEAILLGIARALEKADENHRKALKKEGLLTRDPRVVERKKYGQLAHVDVSSTPSVKNQITGLSGAQ